jgi:hypothetical protein
MRYYNLTLTNAQTGQVISPNSTGGFSGVQQPTAGISTDASGMSVVEIVATRTKAPSYTFTSHPGGTNQPPDPGALQIEFDLPRVASHRPQGGTHIRVSGVGLQMISQAANLNPVDGVATPSNFDGFV